ncbi:NfeD family protein [Limnohabitans sp.]|uniref:NfeD family protein n=1 Tax=Limnohabitans sp. TaxID=1907725 RepID=UPI0039BCFAF1|nr:hypothetical protein [Comamonadaceae bacterium]
MGDSTMWWVLAGVLVALELLTGTFYLLMLGLGAVAAALVAMADHGLSTQLVAAAMVGGLGAVLLGQWRKRQTTTPQEAQDQQLGGKLDCRAGPGSDCHDRRLPNSGHGRQPPGS